ncbi:MAG: M15 family metallopeptidase [Flavobacteriaceae bacterium]
MRLLSFIALSLIILSCRESAKKKITPVEGSMRKVDTIVQINQEEKKTFPDLNALADTTFIRLSDYSDDFEYDLRYATENNFLKSRVYECAECYTRVKTARALITANADFREQGYKIRFFDCYRPNSVQYKMWEIVPNPQYVANPVKGSIHNRGGAVDITLVTLDGNTVDMGTDFDFFGRKAYHDNTSLPAEILQNRKILKETMEKYGFWSIRTEWWHYNLGAASRDEIANFKWPCP